MPTISIRDAFIAEPASSYADMQFRITLDTVATAPVTINYAMLDVTATGERDYDQGAGQITIQTGQQEVALPVRVYGDTVLEGNEQFNLVLTSATNGTLAGGAAALLVTGTILESGAVTLNNARAIAAPVAAAGAGALPTLDVRSVTVFEGNSSYAADRFLVMLDKVATAPVTFSYYLQDATASSQSGDYLDTYATFTIQAGQQSAFISTRHYGDIANEGQESFNLVITNVANARLAGNAAALVSTATIIDGDDGVTGLAGGIGDFAARISGPASVSTTLPTMRVFSPSVIEGNDGYTALRYLVVFDRVLTSDATVDYFAQDGTASDASGDYNLTSGTATFRAGAQSGWIEIRTYGDTNIEANETVQLVLSGATNAVFEGGAAALLATGTIIDDDNGKPNMVASTGPAAAQVFGTNTGGTLPTLTVVSTSVAEGNSGYTNAGVYVLLSKPSATAVTFRYDTVNGTAVSGSDYLAASGTFTIPAGKLSAYISVRIYGDTAIEGDEAFTVRLSNLSNATFAGGGAIESAQVLIRDNDGGGTAGQKAGPVFTNTISSDGLVLYGTAFGDVHRGGAGNDRLYGAEGNDTLTGGLGNDLLDGGSGYDTTLWSGAYRQYAVSGTATSGFNVSGVEGQDVVTNVERFTFVDGNYVVDPDSAGAQVQRMYDTVLGRAPDAVGLDYWVDRMEDTGLGLNGVALALASSPEFAAATGGLGNPAFVDYVYSHALGRAADASGRAYWIDQLDRGLSRGDMLVGFSESGEHRGRTADQVGRGYFQTDDSAQAVALLYDSFTGRSPDIGGLTFWTGQLKAGTYTLPQVSDAFAASGEFQNAIRGKTNGELVDFMYQNTLDRLPDAGGRAFWVDQLGHGLTQGGLLLAFSQSAEHANLLASHIIGGIDIV